VILDSAPDDAGRLSCPRSWQLSAFVQVSSVDRGVGDITLSAEVRKS
jgi:hypothetical protein